uniref:SGNH domain-containing protein n=1 Tax=Angiostrongylus cantonensis TaxID=6313 RepID=A0A158PC46_ANGCA
MRVLRFACLSSNQLEQQSIDYPLSLSSLNSCIRVPPTDSEDTADSLRPTSVSIYADIGHMTTYCKSNLTLLQADILDSCDHRSSSMELPSLDKMLKIFNPEMVVVNNNKRDDSLADQARAVASQIQQTEGYENIWKLIVIAASIQDGQASESRQTAVEVLGAIQELHRLLTLKTFIVVIRTSGDGIWSNASHSNKACQRILNEWKSHSRYNSISVWDQMEIIVQNNFREPNFTVEVFPLLRESTLSTVLGEMDLSVLGYDCAHFSERGLSLLHTAIWNSFFIKNSNRQREYRPLASPLLCPDFRCPFFRTLTNSGLCIWNPLKDSEPSMYTQLITACVVLLSILLMIAVLFFIFRKPRRTDDIKKPVKAFGASLSSLKFIDEDVV